MPLYSGALLAGSPEALAYAGTGGCLVFSPSAYLILRSSIVRNLYSPSILRPPAPDFQSLAADSPQGIQRDREDESVVVHLLDFPRKASAAGAGLGVLAPPAESREALPTSEAQSESVVYEDVSLLEFEYDSLKEVFVYPCPCGDLFELPLSELRKRIGELHGEATGEFSAIATCPSCSLKVRALFEKDILQQISEEYKLDLLDRAS